MREDAQDGDGPRQASAQAEDTSEEGQRRRRKRRRRRGGRREDGAAAGGAPMPPDAEQPDLEELEFPGGVRAAPMPANAVPATEPQAETEMSDAPVPGHDEAREAAEEQGGPKPRSRRRRRPRSEGGAEGAPETPRYAGPTPADPFANVADIFDILEQAEQRITPPAPQPPVAVAVTEAAAPASVAPNGVEPALAMAEAVAPVDPVAVAASSEPLVGPAVKPVVIGTDEVAVERKRGWWRR